jgi:uncharacterized damage-inducible protein DinB
MSIEDCEAAVAGLTPQQIWQRPDGVASIGFHLAHLAGATDRLLTYARGEKLSMAQVAALMDEGKVDELRPPVATLLSQWRAAVAAAHAQLSATPEATLTEPRTVGRAQLPSTVIGLLFHAAEHASRHTGQLVTTAKIARGQFEVRGV